ncbi:MAG: hypothetical protein JWM99_119 [Verrucomicrobiales bacterium]|nr:hypothetical protein [Verrucomicrobiales bacterium]
MGNSRIQKVSSASAERSDLMTLSLAQARAIALRSQGLADNRAPFGLGKAAVLAAVQHLGYIQVDCINVIQRAHHHALWSRVPDYAPDMLHELQSPDGAVFEYWNHASSYLPTRDYRFSLPLMRKYRQKLHWSDESPELRAAMRRVLGLIKKNGPLKISEVESTTKVAGWSETSVGKIERRALHELWMRGDIMIRSRSGFQKVFDLAQRVLPENTETRRPAKREAAEFHVRRGLRALGIARAQELHYLQDSDDASALREAISTLIESGEVIEVRIAEFPKIPVFALREAMELSNPLERNLLRFLSPFDNLTIQRKRLKWLFDFDYTVEIYVPAAKRKYGYFALPILWGDRLIGRLDAKANRIEGRLVVNHVVFEPAFSEAGALQKQFVEALHDFTRFQQCDEWEILRVEPKLFRGLLS